jgi:hypothetical protein
MKSKDNTAKDAEDFKVLPIGILCGPRGSAVRIVAGFSDQNSEE